MSFNAFHTILNSIDKICKCMQTSIIPNTKETLSRNKKKYSFMLFFSFHPRHPNL